MKAQFLWGRDFNYHQSNQNIWHQRGPQKVLVTEETTVGLTKKMANKIGFVLTAITRRLTEVKQR